MDAQKKRLGDFSITTKNIGGLADSTINFKNGLNVVEAANASGKTSLLRAFLLSVVPVNGSGYGYILNTGTKEGFVQIEDNDGNKFRKELARMPRGVTVKGDNLIDESLQSLAQRFAIGGPDNELLNTVRSGQNLKELLLEHTNINILNDQLRNLENHKIHLTRTIESLREKTVNKDELIAKIKNAESKLVNLIAQQTKLESEKKKHNVEEGDNRKFETATVALEKINFTINQLSSSISNLEKRISYLESDSTKLTKEIDNMKSAEKIGFNSISNDIDKLTTEKQYLTAQIDSINHFIDEITRLIESPHIFLSKSGNNTETSLLDGDINCPVCGSNTKESALDTHKKSLIQNKKNNLIRASKIEKEMSDLNIKYNTAKKAEDELKIRLDKLSKLHLDLTSLKTQMKQYTNQLIDAKKNKEYQESVVKQLEKNIETESAETTKKLTAVSQEIGMIESEIKHANSLLKSNEQYDKTLKDTRSNLKKVEDEIVSLRNKIRNNEENIRKTFNETIARITSSLQFKNIDVITMDSNFDLRVTRTSEDGAGYFDKESIKTLSKSELEVVGIIVMLSGYIVYGLNKFFPIMILDELTFMDKTRLDKLIEYISKIVETVILTTLSPEKITGEINRYKL
ncbi:MAG: hypothetical protein Q7J10_05540 [Methanosarcinaceae archaeon]|nr:hypothetical protein [Methanosarcinaceae archaeon]